MLKQENDRLLKCEQPKNKKTQKRQKNIHLSAFISPLIKTAVLDRRFRYLK